MLDSIRCISLLEACLFSLEQYTLHNLSLAGGEYIFHPRVGKQWSRWWLDSSFKVSWACDSKTAPGKVKILSA